MAVPYCWLGHNLNPHNEHLRSKNQAKIVEAIYRDEYFGFMTFGELVKATGLTKPTLANHLRELSQEVGREGAFYSEISTIVSRHPEMGQAKPDGPLPLRRLLKMPILITKQGAYTLHPLTRWALDRGIYPRIVRDRKSRRSEPYSKPRNQGD